MTENLTLARIELNNEIQQAFFNWSLLSQTVTVSPNEAQIKTHLSDFKKKINQIKFSYG